MKSALITGASRGIGKGIAAKMASEGYNLILICRENIDFLKKYGDELHEKYGISYIARKADVSDYLSIKEIFDSIDQLDVLINNAGISYTGLLSDMTPEKWHHVISVNLDSVFYTSKLAIPLMLRKKAGRIINISSVYGNIGASTEVAYCASKGGINAFTRALAKELAPSGISVNAIACGFIDTDMNMHLDEEERESLRNEIPADRFGLPEDIADAVNSLLTASTYLTGQIIAVDGGWT